MKYIIIIFLLSANIHAQEASALFGKYIPEGYNDSSGNLTTINALLEAIPEIDLGLFYYLIESLKIDENNKSDIMLKKFIQLMNRHKLKAASNLHEDSEFFPFPPDSNKMNYFKMIYLSKRNGEPYLGNLDYGKIVYAYENKKIKIQGPAEVKEASLLFSKFIPQEYFRSAENITTIKVILNAIPEINLSLFYFLLESLKMDGEKDSNIVFRKFIHYMNYEKQISKAAYYQWNNYQIQIIKESELEGDIKEKAISNFKADMQEGKIADKVPYPMHADSNMINYYKMIFYSGQNNEPYDSLVDYATIADNYEQSIIEKFRVTHEEIKSGKYANSFFIPLIGEMKKYWFVFQKFVKKGDNLNNFIVDFYLHKYSNAKPFFTFHVSPFYNNNSLFVFKHTGPTGTPLILSLNDRLNFNYYGFSIGCKYQLSDQKSNFSFVSLDLSCGHSMGGDLGKIKDIHNSLNEISNEWEIISSYSVRFINSIYEINSLNFFELSFSTPVYYLTPDIFISFGSSLYLNAADYSLSYDYESRGVHTTRFIPNDSLVSMRADIYRGNYYSSGTIFSFRINPAVSIEYEDRISAGIKLGYYFQSFFVMINI